MLGNAYFSGNGVAMDRNRAHQLFKSSAEQGLSLGQLNLAATYFNGYGTERDIIRAKAWMIVAEATGKNTLQKVPSFAPLKERIDASIGPAERSQAKHVNAGRKLHSCGG
jgi:hypothetical protein